MTSHEVCARQSLTCRHVTGVPGRSAAMLHGRLVDLVLNDVLEGEGYELVTLADVELALKLDPENTARQGHRKVTTRKWRTSINSTVT